MDPIGRSITPFVRHADEATYVRALCWRICRAEGDWSVMGTFSSLCLLKLFHRFYLIKDTGDWCRKLDLKRR